jgi:membrane associated rhomboid family serine protease
LRQREPIFNAPGVVVWLVVAFFVVHGLRLFLPTGQSDELTVALAFIPARWSAAAAQVPGGPWAAVTSMVTHVFVHGDIAHLLVNSAWLLAFGTPVARRTDVVRFLAFFLLCGVAGALFYLVVNPGSGTLVIGASGAISGLMGAAFRFLFVAIREGDTEALAGETRRPPLMSLGDTLRDRRVLTAIAGWTVLNVVLAWGAAGLTEAAGIAWEAHLGGFYAGLLTFGLFDRPPPNPVNDEPDDHAADAG